MPVTAAVLLALLLVRLRHLRLLVSASWAERAMIGTAIAVVAASAAVRNRSDR
jgi:hypothetical protein